MTARISVKQAEALGITPQRRKPEPWQSRCTTCNETLTGETAATRHMVDTGHNRYESVVT